MLCEITIENVAVIEKAAAVFGQGFTVLTGETGAGKSILIDSINVILGSRASRDIVRSGAPKASIWASFRDIPDKVREYLTVAGYSCGAELLLYREVSADGKSGCRINGVPATAAMLKEVCGGLVNIHGQHDNQNLLNPAKHIEMLDAFAQNAELSAQYAAAYQALVAVRSELKGLTLDETEKKRRIELLRFEADEIEAAALLPGEEEELLLRRTAAHNTQAILEALSGAYAALSGGDETQGAATLLANAAREMSAAAAFAKDLAHFAETLDETYYTVKEIASDIQNRISDFEFGEQAIEAIEERLDLFYRLKQKYGKTLEDVTAYGENARRTLLGFESSQQRMEELQRQYKLNFAQVEQLAGLLTQSRLDAFDRLNSEIAGALAFLNMPGITMTLQNKRVEYGMAGQDEMEFNISTNPGEVPKPLVKIASGGELARIMLALKSALAERDDVPPVSYDEIDTGISGLAVGRIGQQLRANAAEGRQVICVTHTAQVAAYARRHLLIEKQVDGGRTYTSIRELPRGSRVEELARIISGDRVTPLACANAEEMLRMAES
jgi:DNA repair protein RecN (Recombination protein N)